MNNGTGHKASHGNDAVQNRLQTSFSQIDKKQYHRDADRNIRGGKRFINCTWNPHTANVPNADEQERDIIHTGG